MRKFKAGWEVVGQGAMWGTMGISREQMTVVGYVGDVVVVTDRSGKSHYVFEEDLYTVRKGK